MIDDETRATSKINLINAFSLLIYHFQMLSNFLPFVYGLSVFVLLILAARIMLNGFFSGQASLKTQNSYSKKANDDRTGMITVHPELLNKDGCLTDEDLLTVRFSNDTDHPKSS